MYDQEAAKFVVVCGLIQCSLGSHVPDDTSRLISQSVLFSLEASRREILTAGSTASYRLSRLFASQWRNVREGEVLLANVALLRAKPLDTVQEDVLYLSRSNWKYILRKNPMLA